MIYIYGDSHAKFLFSKLQSPYIMNFVPGITMHRVGRDNQILKFDTTFHEQDTTLCFVFGEIDCRHHIQRQVDNGREEDEVIQTLVSKYIDAIRNNIRMCKQVFIIGVVPTTSQSDFNSINGTEHGFLFSGTEEDRIRTTRKVNEGLQKLCVKHGFTFLAPYDFYTGSDGCLIRKYSDSTVHIRNNTAFLKSFTEACV